MKRHLLVLALAAAAVTACQKQEAPADTAPPAATTEAPAVAPAPTAVESEAARTAADVPFDIKGFAGNFSGTLPPAIDAQLTLNADGTFKLDETSKGGKASIDGTWTVEADDKHIRLDPNSKSENDRVYEIASKDEVRLLDESGKPVEGAQPNSLKRMP